MKTTKSLKWTCFSKSEFKRQKAHLGQQHWDATNNLVKNPSTCQYRGCLNDSQALLYAQRLGFNPSAKSHDLLLGRPISYYYKSKDKMEVGRTGWNRRQVATAIFPSLAVTSKTEDFTSAALQFIPIPESLFEFISFSSNFTLVLLHFRPSHGLLPSSALLPLPSHGQERKRETAHGSPLSIKHMHTCSCFTFLFLNSYIFLKKLSVAAIYRCLLPHSHTYTPCLTLWDSVLIFECFHPLQPSSSHPSKL